MNFTIHQGDNRDTLKTLADNSVDAIITDPPYGIDFLGKSWDANTGALETYTECLRVLKPGGHILAFSAARTYHHLAVTLEQAGFEIRDQIMWLYASGFPKAQDLGKMADSRILKGNASTRSQRQMAMGDDYTEIGHYTVHSGDNESELAKASKDNNKGTNWTPQTPEAQQWAGWKTALKPAHEPICMARKPFKGSTIDNVLEWGTGALNIDATRVGDEVIQTSYNPGIKGVMASGATDEVMNKTKTDEKSYLMEPHIGRFPSNVLGEVEGYQKFFYCPKVSRKERHTGFDTTNIPTNPEGMYNVDGTGVQYNAQKNKTNGNNHPTVKPVELMKYLINLVTPPNSVVLDPFNGSGSTGMAAVELGHTYIGCELDPAYVDIATRRITAWNTPEPSGTTFEELFEFE